MLVMLLLLLLLLVSCTRSKRLVQSQLSLECISTHHDRLYPVVLHTIQRTNDPEVGPYARWGTQTSSPSEDEVMLNREAGASLIIPLEFL